MISNYSKIVLDDGVADVHIKEDSILLEETCVEFERVTKTGFFKKKTIVDKAVIKVNKEVMTNDGFNSSEITSFIGFIEHNKRDIFNKIREKM